MADVAEFKEALPRYDGLLFGVILETDEIGEIEMYLQTNYFLPSFEEPTAAKVKKEVESVFREPDEKERVRILESLEDLLRQTHSILFLVHKKSRTSFHKSVRGVTINEYGWLDFDKIWFHPA